MGVSSLHPLWSHSPWCSGLVVVQPLLYRPHSSISSSLDKRGWMTRLIRIHFLSRAGGERYIYIHQMGCAKSTCSNRDLLDVATVRGWLYTLPEELAPSPGSLGRANLHRPKEGVAVICDCLQLDGCCSGHHAPLRGCRPQPHLLPTSWGQPWQWQVFRHTHHWGFRPQPACPTYGTREDKVLWSQRTTQKHSELEGLWR